MPDVMLQEISPYRTRRASLLGSDTDLYLYVEDLASTPARTVSAVWVANRAPAPVDGAVVSPPGTPPRMGATGTRHPEGCPALVEPRIVWFEEGDGAALVDRDGVAAVVPGWAGKEQFYGYARHAVGRSPLAWELTADAERGFADKVTASEAFWTWRRGPKAWDEIRASGLAHLEQAIGPCEAEWPVGAGGFPELVASRHRLGTDDVFVTATTGLSAQRMAAVEQYVEHTRQSARIELAIARRTPDQSGAELLAALSAIPFGRCTWLGEGHTVGGAVGAYPAFGDDRSALLLTASPPPDAGQAAPELSGLVRRDDPVTYLWVLVIDEETFRLARGRDATTALQHLAAAGGSWIQ